MSVYISLSVQQKNPKLVFCQFVIIRVWAFQFCMQKMTLFVSMVEEDKRRFWWFTEHHDLTSFTFSPSLWGWWWWQSCQQQLCLLDHACDSVKTRMLRLPITMTIVLNLDLERTSAPSNVRGPSKLACFIWLVIICIKRSSFQSWELVHTHCRDVYICKFWELHLLLHTSLHVQILKMHPLLSKSCIWKFYREGFLDVSHVLQEKWCFVFAQRCKQFHTPTHVFLSYCCFSIVSKRRLSCKQGMGCWRVFMLVFIASSIN